METAIMSRPIWNIQMRKELAAFTGKILFEHTNGTNGTLEECTEDAYKVLGHHYDDNGYQLAKEFEDAGYEPDAMLVEELDCVQNECYDIIETHVKKWVKDNDIKLDFPIGAIVKYKSSYYGIVDAEITKLYPEKAMYGVWFDKMDGKKGESHTLISQEKIEPITGN